MTEAKTRDAGATKAVILAAAEDLFAESGFAGTSISRIAKKSGVSGALIMFHFKDKPGLYQAVKGSIIQRYSECLPAPLESAETLPAILHNILRAMFLYYKNNPTMSRMSNWGRLEGDLEPWPGEDEWHHRYMDQIRNAQTRGEIRDDISPYRALIIITGAIHVWWEYRDHMLRDLHQEDQPEVGDTEYFNELMAVLLRGLSPDNQPPNDKG
jgi:TetR/AcrR family transcriptional regulator